MTNNATDDSALAELHQQTATIAWHELQRLFAAGKVVHVDGSLDLVAVAAALQADDKALFQQWLKTGKVAAVSDEQALFWHSAGASVWAVVVSPWVLVQEPRVALQ